MWRKFSYSYSRHKARKNSDDDQARVLSPKAAFKKGTDYIVIGDTTMNSNSLKEEILNIFNSN